MRSRTQYGPADPDFQLNAHRSAAGRSPASATTVTVPGGISVSPASTTRATHPGESPAAANPPASGASTRAGQPAPTPASRAPRPPRAPPRATPTRPRHAAAPGTSAGRRGRRSGPDRLDVAREARVIGVPRRRAPRLLREDGQPRRDARRDLLLGHRVGVVVPDAQRGAQLPGLARRDLAVLRRPAEPARGVGPLEVVGRPLLVEVLLGRAEAGERPAGD